MTVSSVIPVNNYVGNGSTKIFDFDFLIENANELVVTHVSETDVATVLINGIDYSINEIGNVNGSYIIFPLSGSNFGILERNQAISLTLDLEIKQESKFENSSYLNLSILEWTFDYIIRILQILNRKIERSVKIREGSSYTPDSLIETLTLYKEESRKNAQIAKEYAQEAKSVIEENVSWGKIYGNIQNQNDLNELLLQKADIDLCNEIIQNKIYQSSAKETGIINSDTDIYSDILQYAHSTFDKSKFTVVGSVTITDDGLLGTCSINNGVTLNGLTLNDLKGHSWRITGRSIYSGNNTAECIFKLSGSSNSNYQAFGSVIVNWSLKQVWVRLKTGEGSSISIEGTKIQHSFNADVKVVDVGLDFDIDTGTYSLYFASDGATLVKVGEWISTSENKELYYINTASSMFITVGMGSDGEFFNKNLIDLKSISVQVSGQPVFNGNITGTDTYTINEEETQIPYTLSKTGSKIVDVAYRDKVQALYQEQGYAPYYTIDEQNQNFTLPMGEVYGMIERKLDAEKTPHVIEKFVDGKSGYRLYSDGYCEQWGYIASIAKQTPVTLNLIKQMSNSDYMPFLTGSESIGSGDNGSMNAINLKATTFQIYNTSDNVAGCFWQVKGYIEV